MSYVDGYVIPIRRENIEAYRKVAQNAGEIWIEHGALAYKECVAEDMEDKGFCMTFPDALKPEEGETLIFAYVVFKSREHRDEVNEKAMKDPRLSCAEEATDSVFDYKRMVYGGFETIVDL